MKWEVNERGRVALKEVAKRTARVMESVKLACRQENIGIVHDRFPGYKSDVNAIRVSDLSALLTRLNSMARHTLKKRARRWQKAARASPRGRSTRIEAPEIAAARRGLAPFPPKEEECEPVDTSLDEEAAAKEFSRSFDEPARPTVSYGNGMASVGDWNAFVKAAEIAARLAEQVGVYWFKFANKKLSFERHSTDEITLL